MTDAHRVIDPGTGLAGGKDNHFLSAFCFHATKCLFFPVLFIGELRGWWKPGWRIRVNDILQSPISALTVPLMPTTARAMFTDDGH